MTLQSSFHAHRDSTEASETSVLGSDAFGLWHLGYRFSLHQHPYVTDLVRRLLEKSVAGLQGADTENTSQTLPDGKPRPVLYDSEFFKLYNPNPAIVATRPVKELDFGTSGAYAPYNWELFFHVPLAVAIHLSKSGRYEDAQRWFHYVFDPTDNSDGPTPERFWKVRPFQTTHVELIQEILLNLATRKNEPLAEDTEAAIRDWSTSPPFQPHRVARHRPSAYMFKTVMAYLDNLIAWGDSLFRQDTRETINEATQLYVLAAEILGPRPQEVPRQTTPRPQTYAQLRADLDAFGNAARQVETDIPFELMSFPSSGGPGRPLAGIRDGGDSLYFGVPRNDRLLGYWDTVADRLFKIRNSLNARGIFRQLPLFEPPIDPALLVRAAAAGVDVAAVVAGVNQPLPLVRSSLLIQKASEICQELKALGAALLSAMEKKDAEALQLKRATHERAVLQATESVRYGQLQEAIKNREALLRSLKNAVARYAYYESLLGAGPGVDLDQLAQLSPIDADGLEKGKFTSTEPDAKPKLRELKFDVIPLTPGLPDVHTLNQWEVDELAAMSAADELLIFAGIGQASAALVSLIGQFSTNIQPYGVGMTVSAGGSEMAASISNVAAAEQTGATRLTTQAGMHGKAGAYARREQEWGFQSNAAAGEILQLYKQLRAAQIREAVAKRELENHQLQMRNAEEIETFLSDERTGKTTTEAFYTFMKREVIGLHSRYFDLAFEIARKAERALQHELGDPEVRFLEASYMAGKDGLLAGERLQLDIRRMEAAYHDLNRREYELTKHVSLLQLDPKALLQLRTAGTCTFTLPEELFDLGTPGHYFRRIKTVALSVASVTGPYTGLNARLTLLRSTIRRNALLADNEYARNGADDDRFSDSYGSLDSIVTSTAQNDGGLFEANLRDERKLPFEGHGAVSMWRLELPQQIRQFDYDTIADVVLHVRYTAREGGTPLSTAAVKSLEKRFEESAGIGSMRLFSVRHEFPSEWAKLTSTKLTGTATATLRLGLLEGHYPFWSKGRLDAVKALDLYARTRKNIEASTTKTDTSGVVTVYKDQFVDDPTLLGVKKCLIRPIPRPRPAGNSSIDLSDVLPKPTGTLSIDLNNTSMDELWITVAWAKT